MVRTTTVIFFAAVFCLLYGCNEDKSSTSTTKTKESRMKEENIIYSMGSVDMSGFLVYDDGKDGKRPAVLVVPEWWGLNDYSKMRARELAKLGYVAFAIDVYGNGVNTTNPDTAATLAMPFYQDPQMTKARIDAAIAKIKMISTVDTSQIAAIGYCFGGGMLLNSARMGSELNGVVSFHGTLVGTPAIKELLKTKIFVAHGEADPLVPPEEVTQFRKQMDSIGADYTFISYPGAMHAFTNPGATEMGKKYSMPIAYNAAADTASWNDMKEFLGRVFR